ncbi:PASTA domain-containing protein [Aestuariimicrobium ganziense]|uniref:PASTA domain-containing protein n=1 Tax=Aestuariimicrobium ganziense TaxID=2773677 RepID=UPI00194275D9|nr:PASTA domain-containing protein [Aestuariimicrobium ganziense]
MTDLGRLVTDTVATPLGSVIAAVGHGVADAQQALDEASLAATLALVTSSEDDKLKLLQAIGYRPTFYALPETTGEVKVALKLGSGAAGVPGASAVPAVRSTAGLTALSALSSTALSSGAVSINPARLGLNAPVGKLYATPVDAGYANSFGYSADVSATVSFRIVPIPPPAGVEDLRLVPDLVGATVAAAREQAAALDLTVVVVDAAGTGVADPAASAGVASQVPAKGTIASAGDELRLTLT